VTFYVCDHPVWAQVPHGFSTRLGGVSPVPWDSLNLGASRGDAAENVAENFRLFRCAIGAAEGPLVKNHQVHGTLVRSVTAADAELPEAVPTFDADGLVTDEEGVTLTVFSADCLPILFYDPVRLPYHPELERIYLISLLSFFYISLNVLHTEQAEPQPAHL
jgi:copper oxidase (laccase) domain-containing protein